MTSETYWIGGCCRLYSVLLYAYPPDFRRRFGAPMAQAFRDRCRDAAQAGGRFPLLRFAVHTISDWLRTSVEERAAEVFASGRTRFRRSSVTEWTLTILMYLFAATTLVQAYVVPTPSMESTLMVGDHMLVDRLAYADPGPLGHVLPYRDVERGDVIAFIYPEDTRQTYVKRVIGLPGDRIRMDKGQVIRNGCRLKEPYTQHIGAFADDYRDNFPQGPGGFTSPRGRDMLEHHVRDGEVVVPPGMIFAMGDNRDNSSDSRYWGFVPRSFVVGKPLVVYWSYDAPTEDLETWTLHHVADVAMHFFTRTRWNRTLAVPRSIRAEEAGGAR
jgi:signal peptidase I